MKTVLKLIGTLALVAGLSGCHQYKILEFRDHENAESKLNQLQIMKVSNFFVMAIAEHQFWLCTDKGDELVCNRSCGGELDVQCPMASGGNRAISTNTR